MEEEEKIITANTVDELWAELSADFKADPDPIEYHTVLELNGRRIILDLLNNHGIGFEALQITSLNAYIFSRSNFNFSLYNQGFADGISKLFGMQDVSFNDKDFDERFVIKTNDEDKVLRIFQDTVTRKLLLSLPELSFGIVEYELEEGDGEAPFLELKIERAISDPLLLKDIFKVFYCVLEQIEK